MYAARRQNVKTRHGFLFEEQEQEQEENKQDVVQKDQKRIGRQTSRRR